MQVRTVLLMLLVKLKTYKNLKAFTKNTQESVSPCPQKISGNLAGFWCSLNRFMKLKGRSGVVYPNPGLLSLFVTENLAHLKILSPFFKKTKKKISYL